MTNHNINKIRMKGLGEAGQIAIGDIHVILVFLSFLGHDNE